MRGFAQALLIINLLDDIRRVYFLVFLFGNYHQTLVWIFHKTFFCQFVYCECKETLTVTGKKLNAKEGLPCSKILYTNAAEEHLDCNLTWLSWHPHISFLSRTKCFRIKPRQRLHTNTLAVLISLSYKQILHNKYAMHKNMLYSFCKRSAGCNTCMPKNILANFFLVYNTIKTARH